MSKWKKAVRFGVGDYVIEFTPPRADSKTVINLICEGENLLIKESVEPKDEG